MAIDADLVPLASAIEKYVSTRDGGSEPTVVELSRIPGGASRETYRFTLERNEGGRPSQRRLILRRDPPSSMLESERRIEFEAFRCFHGSKVPVPEMLWLEEDERHLGYPFFIAEEIAGFSADPFALASEQMAPLSKIIAQNKWGILGEIARTDPHANGYAKLFSVPAPEAVWKLQLDYWAAIIDDDAVRSEPIIQGAIRWLRRNPPPPPSSVSIVHGDYRTGNFLYDTAGRIHAILDWEMTHLGDPLEDLAWSLSRAWCYGRDDRRGGLVSRAEAIGIWEQASGLIADKDALLWWELFCCVKGQALWISAARNWIDSPKREVINVLSAWLLLNSQDRAALELMGRL